MPKRDYSNFAHLFTLLAPGDVTGDGTFATGSSVDLCGAQKGALVIVVGDGMTGTAEFKFQHSADDSTWATHPVHTTTGTSVTVSDINTFVPVEVNDLRRYGRILFKVESAKDIDTGVGFMAWDFTAMPTGT